MVNLKTLYNSMDKARDKCWDKQTTLEQKIKEVQKKKKGIFLSGKEKEKIAEYQAEIAELDKEVESLEQAMDIVEDWVDD